MSELPQVPPPRCIHLQSKAMAVYGEGFESDPDFQDGTAFQNSAGQALTASVTPYVVIPNDFSAPGLDPNGGGNVVAVIYKDRLLYAVWGDTGPPTIIGEALYILANVPDGEAIFLRVRGGHDRIVERKDSINLAEAGVEEFFTGPRPPVTYKSVWSTMN